MSTLQFYDGAKTRFINCRFPEALEEGGGFKSRQLSADARAPRDYSLKFKKNENQRRWPKAGDEVLGDAASSSFHRG